MRPKDIGTAAESAVVKYLRANGFPHAERRALHGGKDLGDVTGIPGLVIEVKGGEAAKHASDGQVTTWMRESETERANAEANTFVLVLARTGYGPARAGEWWAILPASFAVNSWAVGYTTPIRVHLRTAVRILRSWDYGTPLGES